MKPEHSREVRAFVRPLIAMTFLAASVATPAQQNQSQENVRIARAPTAAAPAPQPMTWNQVRIIRVKSDRIADFEARVKELRTAMMNRDEGGFMVWQVVFGDQNTYHIVSELQSFASLPELEANPPMEQAVGELAGAGQEYDRFADPRHGSGAYGPVDAAAATGAIRTEPRAHDSRDRHVVAGQAGRVRGAAA